MTPLFFLLIFFVVLIFAIGTFVNSKNTKSTVSAAVSSSKNAIVLVGSREFDVEVADTMMSRLRGLSSRTNLAEGHGMFFIFSTATRYGFWMRGMKFSIDIVWIRGNKVVGVEKNAPPPDPGTSVLSLKLYYPPEPVDRVLELNAGDFERYGLQVGDEVKFNEAPPPS